MGNIRVAEESEMSDSQRGWRRNLHDVIFEADTKWGKRFDVSLLWLIIISLIVVALESVESYRKDYGEIFYWVELVVTVLFTMEYVLRIVIVEKPWKYMTSFFGIIDLLSIIPFYIGLFYTGAHSLIVVRTLRLLRVFRVLKLRSFVGEGQVILTALAKSRQKITVFLLAVISIAMIAGTLMYLVEADNPGFSSIPKSIYWAIVTMTTVGYGDVAPMTPFGQFAATIIMLSGYCIIAVPTGIVGAEIANANAAARINTKHCRFCQLATHENDAKFCKKCGEEL